MGDDRELKILEDRQRDPIERGLDVDQSGIDQVDGDLHCGPAGPGTGACVVKGELSGLEREFDLAHVVVDHLDRRQAAAEGSRGRGGVPPQTVYANEPRPLFGPVEPIGAGPKFPKRTDRPSDRIAAEDSPDPDGSVPAPKVRA